MSKNNAKVSCGPLYRAGRDHYAGEDRVKQDAFAAGFVSGQAEKVYLGACSAAMFRPSSERYEFLFGVCCEVASRYGLTVVRLDTPRGFEIWLHRRPSDRLILESLGELVKHGHFNSALWHDARARLCGIPSSEVDDRFHERQGAQEPCDQ